MRYSPSETEISSLAAWSGERRVEYFLSRVSEAEEVWSIGNASGWELREDAARAWVRVWPYRELAALNLARGEDLDAEGAEAMATSLDHFVQHLLPMMAERGIALEVLSMPGRMGDVVDASRLTSMFEGILEAGDYYLEG